jgi:hypothetical protein
MSEFILPVLGLGAEDRRPHTITWLDGTVVCRGILGDFSPETVAREKAEQDRKDELRSNENVVLLDDWR